jgi:uncharacterized repeat protein (TIGR03803 family)
MKRILLIVFIICYMIFKAQAQTNPANPSGNLVQANDGKLYGMTQQGGSSGCGVMFSYDPVSTSFSVLQNFSESIGCAPYGSLMLANNGKLYSMTSAGGTNDRGVIFSYDPVTADYTVLKKLDNTTGGNPVGNLMQASDGKLYGMTGNNGGNNSGTIFSFDLANDTCITLRSFDQATGNYPRGSLVQANDGKLYGMTYNGSINLNGVLFSYDLISNTYSVLNILIMLAAEALSEVC